jgi:hypothetical protein
MALCKMLLFQGELDGRLYWRHQIEHIQISLVAVTNHCQNSKISTPLLGVRTENVEKNSKEDVNYNLPNCWSCVPFEPLRTYVNRCGVGVAGRVKNNIPTVTMYSYPLRLRKIPCIWALISFSSARCSDD